MHSEKREGDGSPLFLFLPRFEMNKMNIPAITCAISPELNARGLFLVGVKISRDNDVTITVESRDGSVSLDDCEAINRLFTGTFSQDEEDYSLTVTSAGLDGDFQVEGQFLKAVGSKVEVWLKGGAKIVGMLESFSPGAVIVDGARYPLQEVNKVKYYIEF